jgi:hypothetical protein
MNAAVLSFALPGGYRLAPAAASPVVECERDCGWKMRVATLSSLPGDARDRLVQFHEEWHRAR